MDVECKRCGKVVGRDSDEFKWQWCEQPPVPGDPAPPGDVDDEIDLYCPECKASLDRMADFVMEEHRRDSETFD